MTALLMFGGFALLLILGVPIALSLGVSTMAAIAGSPDISPFPSTPSPSVFSAVWTPPPSWPSHSLSFRAT